MPELSLYFLNDTAYPDPTYEPPFTFVGDVSVLKYTIFCSVDCEFGFRWSVDNQYQVISTDTYQLTGGNEESVSMPITARYVQIFVNNIASNPCDLKVQVFFLTNFSGFYGNTGATGAQGIEGATGPQGIQGPTGDSTDITLTSAGGISLVDDGMGPNLSIKGITGATGIQIIDSGGSLVIDSSLASPYQQTGDDISPISNSVNAIVSGSNNTSNNCSNSLIGGSIDCVISGSRTNYSAIIASNNGGIRTSNSNGDGKNCVIVGCDNSNISVGAGAGTGSGLYSCNTCNLPGRSENCVVVGSLNSLVGDGVSNGVYSSDICRITGNRTNNSVILGTTIGEIRTTGGAGAGDNCVIIGSNDCSLGKVASGVAGRQNGIYSSNNCYNDRIVNGCVIMGGDTSFIGGNNTNNSILLGSNASITNRGNFLFSDAGGGTFLSSVANHAFSVRCSGGARFLSNTANTVGVQLASGGNSWAVISDKNVKENINPLGATGCQDIASKFKDISVCTYNYIGNPPEQVCYGPMASDWHSQFGCKGVTGHVSDEYGDPMCKDVVPPCTGCEFKPAKDEKMIEVMDMLGVLMATVQHLQNRIEKLETQ